jgi:hypothetical protein
VINWRAAPIRAWGDNRSAGTPAPPKPIALGKFKPLQAGTSLARICAAALPGKYTAVEIAKAAGLREDQVVHRLLRHGLGAAHGIGHNRDEGRRHHDRVARGRARGGADRRRGEAGGS